MSHPAARPVPLPGKRMRAVGMLLFWLGGALLLAVLAVGVLVAVLNFRGLGETADQAVRIDGSAQVHAEAGDTLLYYFPGDEADSRCEVEGPDPQSLRTHLSSSFTFEGTQYRSQGGFHAGASGTYTVTCTSATGAPVQDALVAPPVDAQGIVFGVFGTLAAVFGGLFFGAVWLVGLILWIVGRSRLRRAGG